MKKILKIKGHEKEGTEVMGGMVVAKRMRLLDRGKKWLGLGRRKWRVGLGWWRRIFYVHEIGSKLWN